MPQRIPRYFIFSRLYSLSGILPFGFFLPLHLYVNVLSLSPNGVATYNNAVHAIYGIPFLLAFEIVLIYIPLLFHILVGLFILSRTTTPVIHYPSWSGFRYLLQRLSGIAALSFLIYHLATVRLPAYLNPQPIVFDTMRLHLSSTAEILFYLLGALAVLFYIANGFCYFLITWGITVSSVSQKLSFRLCMGIMMVLAFVSWATILNFAFYKGNFP